MEVFGLVGLVWLRVAGGNELMSCFTTVENRTTTSHIGRQECEWW